MDIVEFTRSELLDKRAELQRRLESVRIRSKRFEYELQLARNEEQFLVESLDNLEVMLGGLDHIK
jgi:hypothetical protein